MLLVKIKQAPSREFTSKYLSKGATEGIFFPLGVVSLEKWFPNSEANCIALKLLFLI